MPKYVAEFAKSASGGPALVEHYPEAASSSFRRGALLSLNVNGQCVEISTAFEMVLGLAAEAASGVQNTKIKVWVATSTSLFTMSVAGVTLPAQTDVGVSYGLVKENNVWCIDKTDTTNVKVSVVGMDPRDSVTTVNGRLLVVFSAASRMLQF